MESGGDAQSHSGQVSAPFELINDKFERCPARTTQHPLADGITSARLKARAIASGSEAEQTLRGRSAKESSSATGAMLVVPLDENLKLALDGRESERHERQTAQAFRLQGTPETLDDGNRAMLSDSAEARLDSASGAPSAVLALKLTALIRNDVVRGALGAPNALVEQGAESGAAGIMAKDFGADDGPGEVIQNDADMPAEGPASGQSKRQPGQPKTEASRDDTQVHMPHVVWTTGRHNTLSFAA